MRTLTQYEVAWNMHQAGSTMGQITTVVEKHRATIYRWLKRIKRIGIMEFLRRKLVVKLDDLKPEHRRMLSRRL